MPLHQVSVIFIKKTSLLVQQMVCSYYWSNSSQMAGKKELGQKRNNVFFFESIILSLALYGPVMIKFNSLGLFSWLLGIQLP